MTTAQEMFETAVRHMAMQGEPSLRANDSYPNPQSMTVEMCYYRGDDGRKCAAGVFIPDDAYLESMESKSFFALINAPEVHGEKWVKFLEQNDCLKTESRLIQRLQGFHDNEHTWKSRESFVNSLRVVFSNFHKGYNIEPLNLDFLETLQFGGKLLASDSEV